MAVLVVAHGGGNGSRVLDAGVHEVHGSILRLHGVRVHVALELIIRHCAVELHGRRGWYALGETVIEERRLLLLLLGLLLLLLGSLLSRLLWIRWIRASQRVRREGGVAVGSWVV